MFSVVILSRTPSNLEQCVGALMRQEPSLSRDRIIVVDDDETGAIEEHCVRLGLTRRSGSKPFIFAANANIGLNVAFDEHNAKAAVLLNDDALLRTNRGFTQMCMVQQMNQKYGIVSAVTNSVGNQNQTLQSHGPYIRPETRMLCFVCVLISARTWRSIGGLDERFVGYGLDDDDYSLRARLAGIRLGIYDGCFVDHASLPSTFRGRANKGGDFSANLQRFVDKWGMDNHGNVHAVKRENNL